MGRQGKLETEMIRSVLQAAECSLIGAPFLFVVQMILVTGRHDFLSMQIKSFKNWEKGYSQLKKNKVQPVKG